ncbi:MAG: hypothetical protein QXF07_02775 [Candidatus Micrarchaeia archaeon]
MEQIVTKRRKNNSETQEDSLDNTTAPTQNSEEINTNALIQKYHIKSLAPLNYLHAKNKFTCKEWSALKPFF